VRKSAAERRRDVLFQFWVTFQSIGCSHVGPRRKIAVLGPALESVLHRFINGSLAKNESVSAERVVRGVEEDDAAGLLLIELVLGSDHRQGLGRLLDLVSNRFDGCGRVGERFVIHQQLVFAGFDLHRVPLRR
jgi:hypothetical protein